MTKFVLDSGDPQEYKKIAKLAKEQGSELWGSTTNPSLIAKKLTGKKMTPREAFALQKELVLEIVTIVPGAVSAEVYADMDTTGEEMAEQGRDIATWHQRVVVKLPTTKAGFEARSMLRKEKIPVNNTLVFSQQQIFAICLHERIMQEAYGPTDDMWPPFISPFVGRLDDKGEDGMMLVENGMQIKKLFSLPLPNTALAIWMLEASVRNVSHIKRGLSYGTELLTAPEKIYTEWFGMSEKEQEGIDDMTYAKDLQPAPLWQPPKELIDIQSEKDFFTAIDNGTLDIRHPLTDTGIEKFIQDWKAILTQQ
jgi:transaldolase